MTERKKKKKKEGKKKKKGMQCKKSTHRNIDNVSKRAWRYDQKHLLRFQHSTTYVVHTYQSEAKPGSKYVCSVSRTKSN